MVGVPIITIIKLQLNEDLKQNKTSWSLTRFTFECRKNPKSSFEDKFKFEGKKLNVLYPS
jgi:hypothetical protein